MVIDRNIGLAILFKESLPPLLVLTAWDFVVVILFQVFHQEWMEMPTLPLPLIGSALVLYLTMRSNNAYSRWWEARSLWGTITNNCRSFGRQAATMLGDRSDLARATVAYAHALRGALADEQVTDELKRLLSPQMLKEVTGKTNQANAILYQLGYATADELGKRGLNGEVLRGPIDRILSDLANAQGGLERIRKTPLPIHFSVLPRLLVHIFCIVLPLSIVQDLGWITPLGSSLLGLLFLWLEKTGSDLENPFAPSPHALPMHTMCRTIEVDLLQGVGLPVEGPLLPTKGIAP